MYNIFGEFDSYMEINMAAEGLKEEGDIENLRVLAKENGLSDMAEAYIEGVAPELCDPITAAIGKVEVELEAAKGWEALAQDIADYLQSNCDEIDFARQIRRKGKSMEKLAEKIMRAAKDKATSISLGGIRCNYYGPGHIYTVIREYYEK